MSEGTAGTRPRRKPGRPLNQDPAKVRRRRVAAGLSLTALSERMGRSVGHLSEIEGGTRSASPELLAELAAALGREITDLMPDEDAAA